MISNVFEICLFFAEEDEDDVAVFGFGFSVSVGLSLVFLSIPRRRFSLCTCPPRMGVHGAAVS